MTTQPWQEELAELMNEGTEALYSSESVEPYRKKLSDITSRAEQQIRADERAKTIKECAEVAIEAQRCLYDAHGPHNSIIKAIENLK